MWIESLWGKGPEGSTVYVLVGNPDRPQKPIEIWDLGFDIRVMHPVKLYEPEDFGIYGPRYKWAIEKRKRGWADRRTLTDRSQFSERYQPGDPQRPVVHEDSPQSASGFL